MQFAVEMLIGKDTRQYLDLVAEQRITFFREFPYLYQGNLPNEEKYLTAFPEDPQSFFVVIKNNADIAAFVTGIPLATKTQVVGDLKNILAAKGKQVEDYYYLGEAIILPKYRGNGLLRTLLETQEKQLKQWGFRRSCLLTVIRDINHLLKPPNYTSADLKFAHFGYVKTPLTIVYQWPTIQVDGTVQDDKNTLAIWEKELQL